MLDIMIRGGTVIDGSGRPGFGADVGIQGDRIVAVGGLDDARAERVVDATALTVTPGFIDLHTHSDVSLLANPAAESQVHQGVTLEAVGNCGHSAAPVADPEVLKRHVFGYHPSVAITWRKFDEYLSRLEKEALGLSVVAYVGHGAVRLATLGAEQRPATPAEIATMERLVDDALAAGAIGLSTGLEYAPGSSSRTEEVVALARVASRHRALYATHVRNRDYFYEQGIGEALATARLSGARLQLSHIAPKFGAPAHALEHTMEMLDWSRDVGVDVGYDMIPHNWGPTTMSAILPPWAFEGGIPRLLERLGDPATRERIKQNPYPIWKLVGAKRWNDIVLFESTRNADLVGLSFEEIGRRRGVDPYDAVLDILREEGEALYSVTWVGQLISEDDLVATMRGRDCALMSDTITLAPYGPFGTVKFAPSTYGWTARLFQRFVREKRVLGLEDAVFRITGLAAARLGLRDRGHLRPGAFADITVFDPATITDHSTLKEPNRYPSGIDSVIVNGQLAFHRGERMPINAGRVLRRDAA
jgi:N-acyl-D-aspartate/D-glutamate deacylase